MLRDLPWILVINVFCLELSFFVVICCGGRHGCVVITLAQVASWERDLVLLCIFISWFYLLHTFQEVRWLRLPIIRLCLTERYFIKIRKTSKERCVTFTLSSTALQHPHEMCSNSYLFRRWHVFLILSFIGWNNKVWSIPGRTPALCKVWNQVHWGLPQLSAAEPRRIARCDEGQTH